MARHPHQPPRHPQRPTHPVGGKPPVATPTPPRKSRIDRRAVIDRAVNNVRNALTESGQTPNDALRLARILLTRPGVKLGKGGTIFYKGQAFKPAAFAQSDLARLATGATAQARNTAAIQGDPGYLQSLANLGLARDQATSGVEDQRRQALIEFGDPSFAGSDATLAGEARANPFGTSQLLQKNYQDQQSAARQLANRSGVYQGGALSSGLGEAQRQYSLQNQDATTALQQLLAQLSQQQAAAGQAYGVGKSQAQLDAYNALLASGAIHAAKPPNWSVGSFAVKGFGRPRHGAGGGGGGNGIPQPPARGSIPTRTTFPIPNPPVYGGGAPPVAGGRPPNIPPQGTFPIPNYVDLLRRYGING